MESFVNYDMLLFFLNSVSGPRIEISKAYNLTEDEVQKDKGPVQYQGTFQCLEPEPWERLPMETWALHLKASVFPAGVRGSPFHYPLLLGHE